MSQDAKNLPPELWSAVANRLDEPQRASARMVSKTWMRLFSAPETNQKQVNMERHARVWGSVLCRSDLDQIWHELRSCKALKGLKGDEIDLVLIGSGLKYTYELDKHRKSSQATAPRVLLLVVADGKTFGTDQLNKCKLQKYPDNRINSFVERGRSHFTVSTNKRLPVENLEPLGTTEICALFYKKRYDMITIDMSRMVFRKGHDPKTGIPTPRCQLSTLLHVRPRVHYQFRFGPFAHARLKNMLQDERGEALQTVNHYFAKTLEKIREECVLSHMQNLGFQDGSVHAMHFDELTHVLHLRNDDQPVIDIHGMPKAYYKVDVKRFEGHMVISVVERMLSEEMALKFFSPEYVGGLSDSELGEIAPESYWTATARVDLEHGCERHHQALQKARNIQLSQSKVIGNSKSEQCLIFYVDDGPSGL